MIYDRNLSNVNNSSYEQVKKQSNHTDSSNQPASNPKAKYSNSNVFLMTIAVCSGTPVKRETVPFSA